MLDPCNSPFDEDSNDIESEILELRLRLGEILLREGPDRGLLSRRYGFSGLPETGASPQLDLHEYDRLLVAQDQVYLSVARAIVALDEPIALPGQVA